MEKIEITDELRWDRSFKHTHVERTVWIDGCGYSYRNGEETLPRQKAWCKYCATESANVSAPIWLNCKPGYALKCEKCGRTHHMYVSTYHERYIGSRLNNAPGKINPTRGLMTYRQAMDRQAIESMNKIPKKVEDEICERFNITHEEYQKMKEERKERDRQFHKKMENERADRRAKYRDEQILSESEKRKELIERGVLVYKKGIGLVNTETGAIVKL